MLRKLSSGLGRPYKKLIFGHVTSLIGENVNHFPIGKGKCGSSKSGGVASPKYKQASHVGRLSMLK